MERQESYMSPAYDYEGENFVDSLFNDSVGRKEILNMGESTEFKDQGPQVDDFNSPDCPPTPFKGLLDKEESNSQLPGNPIQEHGDESILLLAPTKKGLPMLPNSVRNEGRTDKMAYQEQTKEIKIERYRMKKLRRIWGRKISYDCRKKVADGRERINGRFVKKSPLLAEKSHSHKYSLATEEVEILKDMNEGHLSRTDFTNFILQ